MSLYYHVLIFSHMDFRFGTQIHELTSIQTFIYCTDLDLKLPILV